MNKIKKVLLIDDDTISSWLNQTMLERTGLVASVESIFDGQSAIDYLQQCCAAAPNAGTGLPDLILLDLDMPFVNGYAVLDALLQSQETAWLISDRIVVLTTTINPRDLERATSYQIHDFLVKPLTETKLDEMLHYFLNRKQQGSLSNQKQNPRMQPAVCRQAVLSSNAAILNKELRKGEEA